MPNEALAKFALPYEALAKFGLPYEALAKFGLPYEALAKFDLPYEALAKYGSGDCAWFFRLDSLVPPAEVFLQTVQVRPADL